MAFKMNHNKVKITFMLIIHASQSYDALRYKNNNNKKDIQKVK